MTPFRPIARHATRVAPWCASVVSMAPAAEHTRLVSPRTTAGAAAARPRLHEARP